MHMHGWCSVSEQEFFSSAAFNPTSSDYIRKKYKRKLAAFEDKCGLIPYLSSSMSSGYQEPFTRPIDFDHKIGRFLGLKLCT